MTTENTHYNDSDADATVVEHPSVPETITVSTLEITEETRQEEEPSVASDHQPEDQESHSSSASAQAESVPAELVLVSNVPEATNGILVYTETLPIATMEEEVRPFTEFIEEFRQTEARLNASAQQVAETETFTLFTPTEDQQPAIEQPSSENEIAFASTTQQAEEAPSEQATVVSPPVNAHLPEISTEETTTTTESAQEDEKVQKEAVDTKPKERAVSPLLRPATRIRLPRHKHAQREMPEVEQQAPQVQESTPVADVAPITEPEQPKPARRYRFDRPAASQQKNRRKTICTYACFQSKWNQYSRTEQ